MAMSALPPLNPSTEFQFEDLFLSSSGPTNLASSWGAPPDNAAVANAQLEAYGTTEEDIGDEQDYSDEDEVEKTEDTVEDGTPFSPSNEDNVHKSGGTIKLSAHIGLQSFTTLVMVGKGGFGSVHQVVFKDTNEVLAMKSLKKKHLIATNSVDNTMAEKDILRKIRHPFIVRLHYAFQSDSKLHLVMDFVNGGHLLYHMHKEALFSESQARFYIAQVILALEHLHSLNIIHRDLKPENCLLDSKGHCVLTDFGFAKENVSDPDSCSSFCGTLEYMAPEVVKKNKYGKAADWWSTGILLYDMLVGNPPFQHKSDNMLYKKILNDKLRMPNYLSRECQSLIRGLLQRDLKQRLNVKQIKAHPFFKGMNWDKMLRKEIRPPIIPIIKDGVYDTNNFDGKFVNEKISESIPNSPLSTSQQLQFKGFSYVRSPASSFKL
jgi:serine/threonine protein kinase